MAIYRVTLIAKEIYEIEADDEKEAIEWAYECLNQDPYCFDTVEKVEIKEVK